jgi:hypothetical protein
MAGMLVVVVAVRALTLQSIFLSQEIPHILTQSALVAQVVALLQTELLEQTQHSLFLALP